MTRRTRWRGGLLMVGGGLVSTLLGACGATEGGEVAATAAAPQVVTAEPEPEPVNGWIERSLPDGVHTKSDAEWKSDVIEIPVKGSGGALEYKLEMKQGDVIVYHIDYGDLAHPGDMISEFHGHTEKNAEGIGDLMFYAKTAGVAQSGSLAAPFDGIHGWYLENDGARDVVVTLSVAGYYELVGTSE